MTWLPRLRALRWTWRSSTGANVMTAMKWGWLAAAAAVVLGFGLWSGPVAAQGVMSKEGVYMDGAKHCPARWNQGKSDGVRRHNFCYPSYAISP